MRTFLKKILFGILYYTGIVAFFYHYNKNKQRILVFHHIISDEDLNLSFEQQIVCTPQSKFKWMMKIVNKRFRVTTDIGKPGTAVITFDDGYRAIWNAYEVLKSFNNTAIIFLPLSVIDGETLWIDKIMAWFAYVPSREYHIDGAVISIDSQESRLKAFSACVNSLYEPEKYNPPKVINELNRLYPIKELNIPEKYFSQRFMGLKTEEIQDLKERGYQFGAHSIGHDILSCLPPDKLEIDFRECESHIGKLFNTDVYAYPFGHKRDVNDNVYAISKQSMFANAVMNENVESPSKEKLSRINISHYASKYEIEAALSGLAQWLKDKLKWKK